MWLDIKFRLKFFTYMPWEATEQKEAKEQWAPKITLCIIRQILDIINNYSYVCLNSALPPTLSHPYTPNLFSR